MQIRYSSDVITLTSRSDYFLSVPQYVHSTLLGAGGNGLVTGDFRFTEIIRAGESSDTRATAKNLEVDGLHQAAAGSGMYVGLGGYASTTAARVNLFRATIPSGDELIAPGTDSFVTGTSGDDTMSGGNGDDDIDGDGGNDAVSGAEGNDRLFGGSGDDRLLGGAGWDVLNGGAGWDALEGGAGRDVLFGRIHGNTQGLEAPGNDNYDGGAEEDLIFAGTASDTVIGGAGGDIIFGDTTYIGYIARTTSLNGGTQAFPLDDPSIWSTEYSPIVANSTTVPHMTDYVETYPGEFRLFSINLVAGQTITIDIDAGLNGATGSNISTGIGIYFNSAYVATSYSGSFDTGDIVISNPYLTYAVPTTGTYLIGVWENDGGDQMFEGNESFLLNVSVTGHAATAVVAGDADTLSGGDGGDVVFGGSGSDSISGGNSADDLSGGIGDDLIEGGSGGDSILGGDGEDRIYSHNQSGPHTLPGYGNPAIPPTLDSVSDRDTIYGGNGDDFISAGAGDTIDGGAGFDTLHISFVPFQLSYGGVTADFTQASLSLAGATITGIEHVAWVDGSLFADVIRLDNAAGDLAAAFGNAGNDQLIAGLWTSSLSGGDGNDTLDGSVGRTPLFLDGGNGADTLTGSAEADLLDGGAGADTLAGGLGDDVYVVDDAGDAITEAAGQGTDEIRTALAAFDLGTRPNVEALTYIGAAAFTGTGSALFNWITGGAQADTLSGLGDSDMLFGLDGDDTLIGGFDARFGPQPGDTDDDLRGGAGNDLLRGGDGDDQLYGEADDDNLRGDAGSDLMDGGDGFDFVSLAFAALSSAIDLDFGAFDPRISATFVDPLGGTDTFVSIERMAVTGTDFDDHIVASAFTASGGRYYANQLYGGSGNDVLTGQYDTDWFDGGAGADTMTGGAGNDSYLVDNEGDTIVELTGEGIDTVTASGVLSHMLAANVENLTLVGSGNPDGFGNALANVVIGNDGANVLTGEGADDSLYGSGGNDWLIGDADNDTLYGGAGDDGLVGGTGDDNLDGGDGTDTASYADAGGAVTIRLDRALQITGGAGTDSFTSIENAIGSAFADVLVGNAQANLLDGRAGADTMRGGQGEDVYWADNAGDKVVEYDGEGSDLVNSTVSFSLAGQYVEVLNLLGTAAINGTGNGLANRLVGNSAANVLYGMDGNDRLDGQGGADTMRGGMGNDTYVVDNAGDVIQEDDGQGTDTVEASITYSLVGKFVEVLVLTGATNINGTGNGLANTLIGNAGNNTLNGMGGADSLRGGAGDDILIVDNVGDTIVELNGEGYDTVQSSVTFSLAGQYADALVLTGSANINGTGNGLANVLTGNSGANLLRGGAGDDHLHGGLGSDTLAGEAGADHYWFETALGASNIDTIAGFVAADDTIHLDRSIFAGIAANGTLAAGAFRLGTAALDADDRILYDAATGNIWYDADGTGAAAAVLFAKVAAGTVLTNADFVGEP